MSDISDERRDRLHALLQELGCATDDEDADGALLTGWVIVTSWIGPSGERFLSKGHAAELPHWTAMGMHHEALYGDWPNAEEDDAP